MATLCSQNSARQRHREDTADRAIDILTVTGAIYLVLTSCLSALQMYCERLTAYEQRGLGEGRRRRLRLDAPLPTLPA
jgi:hypothetical protein